MHFSLCCSKCSRTDMALARLQEDAEADSEAASSDEDSDREIIADENDDPHRTARRRHESALLAGVFRSMIDAFRKGAVL